MYTCHYQYKGFSQSTICNKQFVGSSILHQHRGIRQPQWDHVKILNEEKKVGGMTYKMPINLKFMLSCDCESASKT